MLDIVNLSAKYEHAYFQCLEDWSDELKEAGDHKERWCRRMANKGLRGKLAVEDNQPCGMIQYIPVEHSPCKGERSYFILCIWVHGHKQGVGNRQHRGLGKALLNAAEHDVRTMKYDGIAAWGLRLPFWMKASWFKKQGYLKADTNGMAVLMWKPFHEQAIAPAWIRERKKPGYNENKVTVTSFLNGWCPAQNMVHERAGRASIEIGDLVEFREINTCNRRTFLEWGISDALFLDDKQIRTGPPPGYDTIRKKIARKVNKIKQ